MPRHFKLDNSIKRVMDILLVVPGLIALCPVMAIIALMVRIKLGSPILFRQTRPGLQEKPFTILKFRTMTNGRDPNGKLLSDEKRLTPFGKFLRTTSLDELPELFNVLKGDMSLVGPRPLFVRYLPYYSEKEKLRHAVRPGITGWAQINGRNLAPWDERLSMDVWYVENRSLILDLRILLITFWRVFKKEGAYANPDLVETDLDKERRKKTSMGIMNPDKTLWPIK